ncbi:PAS domain-containing protein [Actinospica durhamensis]|uniref:PAS domain-containing protein n=1 Tax=Actinospica durhamensis TaxID=1508375 RepID=A0A941EJE6_9ACTN|nr:PAS domain-containing protein [Actinospica durhamensis]MBR7831622.1 PAS domain-containing protein [Actinospica durhamensis]
MGPTNRTPVRGAARLAAILDALPDALLLVDGSGAIVNANAAALNLFEGESAERLLGKQIALVLPGIGRTLATTGSAPAALTAGPSAAGTTATGPARRPPERMAARRTDGGMFPAEVTMAELAEDDDAGLTLLVVRDLSGVLDVEAELRRQQRQIELILRAASEGIIGVDHEGRIVLVNPAGAKILRYRAADLGGQDAHELLAHSRADGTPLPEDECALLDSVRTGAKHRAEDSVLWRSDGGPVYVDLTTAPVYEGENIIGAVMTFVDNTASRAAARQAAELAEVLDQELRGGLADLGVRVHELLERSVLAYANSGYQTMPFDGAALAALEELEVDLSRLSLLSSDVIDFQQSVLGTPDFEPETVELADLVEEAVAAAEPAAGAVGVEIAAHCAEVEVELDPTLFVKLLVHLLADMVSVSPVGGKIVVTAARRGALARIEIRGPHTGGGPLHLPIAQAIATRHSGTVTTHRIAGKGNTHVIEVPVTQPARAKGSVGSGAAGAANGRSTAKPAPRSLGRTYGSGPREIADESSSQSTPNAAHGQHAPQATPEPQEQDTRESTGQIPKVNGHHTGHAAERRRRVTPEVQARIPAQSRSTLSGSIGSIADLRPSKPMPTGDVWSKPDRSLTSEPPPAGTGRYGESEAPTDSEDRAEPTREEHRPWRAEPEPEPEPPTPSAPPARGTQSPYGTESVPRGRRRAAHEDEPQFVETVPEPEPEPEPERRPERRPEPEPVPTYDDGPQLLLWPDPDEDTNELLRSRGYRPVALGQPEKLPVFAANGSGGEPPFAVFVDPIAAPITRRGLRELRLAAARAELPLLVTAGIGCTDDARDLGPDPSLLLTALCPDGVRMPRVLLVEARADLADALSDLLERQGMQVAHATTDAESRESAVACPPDLVVLDLMQIRRRRVGVVDWLRDRGLLARTPLVVYTAEGTDAGGFASLYLTERATDAEPAGRIGDLLAKIAP